MKWFISILIITTAIGLIFLLAFSPISDFGLIILSIGIGAGTKILVENYWKKYNTGRR